MDRIALVTGGVTGIGAAICLALKAAGYRAIANYFGNEPEAQDFHRSSEVPIKAWNVADFDACARGIAEITASTALSRFWSTMPGSRGIRCCTR